MAVTEIVVLIVLLLITGAFSGVISGLLGIGGGIFLVPVFMFVFEHVGVGDESLMQLCVGTSTATIIATSIRSVLSHNKKGSIDWQVLKTWGPWLSVGAIMGVVVSTSLRSNTLMGVFGVVGSLMGIYMLLESPKLVLSTKLPPLKAYGPLSVFIGFICSMMGIGGGTFGVPALSAFSKPITTAIGTSAGFGLLISLPAAISYLLAENSDWAPFYTVGYVNLSAFFLIIMMTFLTVPFGAKLAHQLPTRLLKRLFAIFIIATALNMLRKAIF